MRRSWPLGRRGAAGDTRGCCDQAGQPALSTGENREGLASSKGRAAAAKRRNPPTRRNDGENGIDDSEPGASLARMESVAPAETRRRLEEIRFLNARSRASVTHPELASRWTTTTELVPDGVRPQTEPPDPIAVRAPVITPLPLRPTRAMLPPPPPQPWTAP